MYDNLNKKSALNNNKLSNELLFENIRHSPNHLKINFRMVCLTDILWHNYFVKKMKFLKSF